jgi:pyridoxamine 5'-phosphate oxidase
MWTAARCDVVGSSIRSGRPSVAAHHSRATVAATRPRERSAIRTGVPVDPLVRFHRWFAQARRAHAPLPEAMFLATADGAGSPSVRTVLLTGADRRGFVFYTHARSRKARDLAQRPRASAVFYWHPIGKQVRVEGRVERVASVEADRNWETYPRQTQLATLALDAQLAATRRDELVASYAALVERWRGKPIPRPRDWIGIRIVPDAFAFWRRRPLRLNDFEIVFRARGRWVSRWQPP